MNSAYGSRPSSLLKRWLGRSTAQSTTSSCLTMTAPRRPVEGDVSWQPGLETDKWERLLRLLFCQETTISADEEMPDEHEVAS